MGFPGGSDSKDFACNAGDPGLIPRWGRSPGEGNATHSSILACEFPWTGSLPGESPWGRKDLDMAKQLILTCVFNFILHIPKSGISV